MSGGWQGSDRRGELPGDWSKIRGAILTAAGGRCVELMRDGSRCRDRATDVDHITPGDNHHPSNLRALCAWHHARKSAREGNAARTPRTQRHPSERHPGLAGTPSPRPS